MFHVLFFLYAVRFLRSRLYRFLTITRHPTCLITRETGVRCSYRLYVSQNLLLLSPHSCYDFRLRRRKRTARLRPSFYSPARVSLLPILPAGFQIPATLRISTPHHQSFAAIPPETLHHIHILLNRIKIPTKSSDTDDRWRPFEVRFLHSLPIFFCSFPSTTPNVASRFYRLFPIILQPQTPL